ncbi:MAG TPA: MoaD/ThiS family protein [Pirellulales bacterium]|jgi:molybdopterin converting factor small subunit|nr:MoaD/ThiS family protein [Pirellulales bacterium]HEV3022066.1 MoaD/ThiS family protein [Pirellulales bacterium]
MNVRLQLFAVARQLAGAEFIELILADGATVGELRRVLAECRPELAHLLPHLMFAVNAEYASDETRIPPDAALACIPPVSGG